MQRVENRKLYDTELAEEIARYVPNTDRRDFNFFIETLYKTADGEYFLHGEGGENTTYATCSNGGRCGSEELDLLSEADALAWCERRAVDAALVLDEFEALIETYQDASPRRLVTGRDGRHIRGSFPRRGIMATDQSIHNSTDASTATTRDAATTETRFHVPNGTTYEATPTPSLDTRPNGYNTPVTPVGLAALRTRQIDDVLAQLTADEQPLPAPFTKQELYSTAADIGIPIWEQQQKQQFTDRILNHLDYQWEETSETFVPCCRDALVEKITAAAASIVSTIDEKLTRAEKDAVLRWCTAHGIDSLETETRRLIVARQAVFAHLLHSVLDRRSDEEETPHPFKFDAQGERQWAGEQSSTAHEDLSVLDTIARLATPAKLAAVLDERYRLQYSPHPAEAIGGIYESLLPSEARRTVGQFRTPSEVASTMRVWAAGDGEALLDPGIGPAALSTPLLPSWDVDSDPGTVVGVDRSPLSVLMGVTAQFLSGQHQQPRVNDFLSLSPSELRRDIDAIVCNPPFSRHHDIPSAYKNTVNASLEAETGRSITATSPLYAYFCYHLREFLDPGDRAALLLPQGWLGTKFGETLKRFLLDEFRIHGLVQFDPAGKQLFDTAQTTALIAFLEAKNTGEPGGTTRFIRVNEWPGSATIRDAVNNGSQGESDWGDSTSYPQSELSPERNWQARFEPRSIDTSGLTPLGDLVSIRRGKTTGKVDFFCLSDTDVDAAGLDTCSLSRLIRSPSVVDGCDFRPDDWEQIRAAGGDVWLFDPAELPAVPESPAAFTTDSIDHLEPPVDDRPAVLAYLAEGISQYGLAEIDCLSDRPYWYRPRRAPSRTVLVQSASRDGFRFILNETDARHINNMYAFTEISLDETELKALLAFLNSDLFDVVARDQKKTRQGGFEDITPNSLESVPVIDPTSLSPNIVTRLAGLFDELRETARQDGDCNSVHARIQEILTGTEGVSLDL